MLSFEVLRDLESFYAVLKSPQEDSKNGFTWISGIPHPFLNGVMHLSSVEEIDIKIDQLISQIAKNTLSFWVHEYNSPLLLGALQKRGFQSIITCTLMVLFNLEAVSSVKHDIRAVKGEDFHSTLAKAFHFDEITKTEYAKLFESTKTQDYVFYLEGVPMATGTLIAQGKIGAIMNIGTLPERQKKGCGRAIMQFLIHLAKKQGLEKLVLLSSPAAKKLYNDLGFISLMDIDIYAQNVSS